jgi:protein arginine kinase
MIPIEEMVARTGAWLKTDGPHADRILSTRVRLARNLAGTPFVGRALDEDLQGVYRTVTAAALATEPFRGGAAQTMNELPLLDRQFLIERHLVSHDLTGDGGARGLVLAVDERASILVNDEDHVRIQSLEAGFRLEESWARARQVDAALEDALPFAWSGKLGYLTACPTNVGTGLRASVLLHLPALVLTQRMKQILVGVTQVGLTVRGYHGEGTEVMGNFLQLSNQVTLGQDEEEILTKLTRVVRQVLDWEEKAQDQLLRQARWQVEDKIMRAVGVLRSCRLLSSQEAIGLLSAARFGNTLGMRAMPEIAVLNELLIRCQPAHLQKAAGREMNSEERNEYRARLVREILGVDDAPNPAREG